MASPSTILQSSFINFTGDLQVSTLFMPVTDSFVAVQFYMTSSAKLNRHARFSWQDENGGNSVLITNLSVAPNAQSISLPFRIKGGTALSLSTEGAQILDPAASIYYAIDLYSN